MGQKEENVQTVQTAQVALTPSAEGTGLWTRTDKFLLLIGFLLCLLQFVFIPFQSYDWLGHKAVSIAGMALWALILIMATAVLLVSFVRFCLGKAGLFLTARSFVAVALIITWWFMLQDAFFAKQQDIGQSKFEKVSESNEREAVQMLTSLHQQMQAYQASHGTFGRLADLEKAGQLPAGMKRVENEETYTATGYVYFVFLPSDENQAKSRWCAYAWPLEYGRTGFYSFFIHEPGNLHYRESDRLSGPRLSDGPEAYDAYFPGFVPGEAKDFKLMRPFRNSIATGRWAPMDK